MARTMTTPLPLIYLALSSKLVEGLFLEPQLERLNPVAQVERWPGPEKPSLETVTDALRRIWFRNSTTQIMGTL
jgi:hypothetical protein